ncbi:hypothetical protein NKR23_g2087 [Pleurostoma richardsiae]|uniref:Uncharacterized protein n=1 Tax=Pleurostoma richardsiae TaxID=41990 RepID=A0AA38VJ22_9PEZI|nr:hypothetical protein NKR23_g2087 [Pleurostoma richardsiae]
MSTSKNAGQPKGFQFITSVSSVQRDSETRRRVRAHARRLPAKQDVACGQGPPPPSGQPSLSQKELVSRFRVKTYVRPGGKAKGKGSSGRDGMNADDYLEQILEFLGNDSLREYAWRTTPIFRLRDLPGFQALPVRITPREEVLIRAYDACVRHNACSLHPEGGEWFEYIKSDGITLHAFLATIASLHNALYLREDLATVSYHRAHSIRLINERLNTELRSSHNVVSDQLLVSVSMMANTETILGCYEAAAAHMGGLRRIIEMRGGAAKGLAHNPHLGRAVSWVDMVYATAWDEPLAFGLVPDISHALETSDRITTKSAVASATGPFVVLDPEILASLEQLRAIVEMLNKMDFADLAQRERVADAIYAFEYNHRRLEEGIPPLSRYRAFTAAASAASSGSSLEGAPAMMPFSVRDEQPWDTGSQRIDLSDVIKYSAHVFLHIVVRRHPAGAGTHRLLCERLWTALEPAVWALYTAPPPTSRDLPMGSSSGQTGLDAVDPELFLAELPSFSFVSEPPSQTQGSITLGTSSPRNIHEAVVLWALFVGSCSRCRKVPDMWRHVPGAAEVFSAAHARPVGGNGGLATGGEEDLRSMFVVTLKTVCEMWGLTSMEALRIVLREVMWVDGWCEEVLEPIWKEMGIIAI